MDISAKMVKELRDRTAAGMMDCKKALKEANGDSAEAEKILRKADKVKAGKKAGRSANQGVIETYIHAGGKLGVMVEINCETDFAASNEQFLALSKDIAMHTAAADPKFLSRDQVDAKTIEDEREIYRAQVAQMGKPENVVEKIVEGKLNSFYAENCLLEQAFVKEPGISITELMQKTIATIGENIQIRRYVRFKLGDDAAPTEAAEANSEE